MNRLRVLTGLGRMGDVVPAYRRLHDRFDRLPAYDARREAVSPWRLRKQLLGIRMSVVMFTDGWEKALEAHSSLVSAIERAS